MSSTPALTDCGGTTPSYVCTSVDSLGREKVRQSMPAKLQPAIAHARISSEERSTESKTSEHFHLAVMPSPAFRIRIPDNTLVYTCASASIQDDNRKHITPSQCLVEITRTGKRGDVPRRTGSRSINGIEAETTEYTGLCCQRTWQTDAEQGCRECWLHSTVSSRSLRVFMASTAHPDALHCTATALIDMSHLFLWRERWCSHARRVKMICHDTSYPENRDACTFKQKDDFEMQRRVVFSRKSAV